MAIWKYPPVTGMVLAGLILAATQAPDAARARPAVERIAFIDRQAACACTKKQIDAAWALLHKVLAGRKIPVDRIDVDKRPADAKRFRAKRAFMVLPAIYFLGSGDRVVELLQGEIEESWIRKALR